MNKYGFAGNLQIQQFLGFLFVCLALLIYPTQTWAGKRVALLIGNSDYAHAGKLPNPRNDASDLSKALEDVGFEVTIHNDIGFDKMRRALRSFSRQAQGSEMALVFYAGHGMEVNKHNYLIPTDAKLESDSDISYEAIPLDLLSESVSGAKVLRLILLDACRNNPFTASMKRQNSTRAIGRGLARIEPTAGTLVSYAAKEGTVASDGDGRNSPYTKALIEHLGQPGLEVNFLFRKIRDKVLESTGGQQEPHTYGSLPGKQIFLRAPLEQTDGLPAGEKPNTSDGVGQNMELALWEEVKNSKNRDLLSAYLSQFPKGIFSGVARVKLRRLEVTSNNEPRKPENKTNQGAIDFASLPKQNSDHIKSETRNPNQSVNQCDILASDPYDTLKPIGVEGTDFNKLRRQTREAIDACKSVVAQNPANGRYKYQLGRALYVDKQFVRAFSHHQQAADLGHAPAMNDVGMMLVAGDGVTKNATQGLKWLKKSANAGLSTAITNIGWIYHKGLGVKADFREALVWYRQGESMGNPYAIANLALMYFEGSGVKKDEKQAFKLIFKAANMGVPIAKQYVAWMYDNGKGVEKNESQALHWYKIAANDGDPDAMAMMSWLHTEGKVVGRDLNLAAKYMAYSLQAGNATAIHQMTKNSNNWGKSFRQALQRVLREEGAYSGAIDGSFGRGTIAAIKNLSSANASQ